MVNTLSVKNIIREVLLYLDDILIPSKSIEENILILEEVLKKLDANDLTLNIQKCEFIKPKIQYLGYRVSQKGNQPGEK